ncbi:hypothetical protein RB195_015064 [Necator americanus]|uniref:guanylate cyclase n=1 Tax=Necator americanus TaxID=51031 RepID=A0ABR1E3B1_NECAM
MAQYAAQLHDAFLVYAHVLNESLTLNKSVRDGRWMLNSTAGVYKGKSLELPLKSVVKGILFSQGALSNVTIAFDGSRVPRFVFYGVGTDNEPEKLILIEMDRRGKDATLSLFYRPEEEQNMVWKGRARPKAVPDCGFTGANCPPSFIQQYQTYVILAACVAMLFIAAVIILIVIAIRAKQKERERLDALWKIPYYELTKSTEKDTTCSFVSGLSATNSKVLNTKKETDKICYFYYGLDALTAYKHSVLIRFDEATNAEFRQMRRIEHDNLNRFVGISLNAGLVYSLWRFCARGTLQEVITKGSLPIDNVFMQSLMSDIVTGLKYIHESPMAVHGRLTSQNCSVDDRWQVKLSYYGMSCIKSVEQKTAEEKLWTAPEILRGDADDLGTKEGDVYSFAIIASELITKRPAWDLDNRMESPEEIVRMVSKPAKNPFRPGLDTGEVADVMSSLINLIQDCWSEAPKYRPTTNEVQKLLKSMQKGKKLNLMDHVMNTLENYASSLEEEVEERMKELVAEKKKSDALLYRMLPKQVADKLKLGESVEPESYEVVTIFFSDVVSFTTLASKCTPMQVVALLNGLYTFFDEMISRQDVYKVETIGDGYLCASGLPNRNGQEHVKAICDLSLELISGLRRFQIPHLPNETLNIRVGINTGASNLFHSTLLRLAQIR